MNDVTLDGKLFFWCGQIGTADASTLGFAPGQWPKMIAVRSPKTGRVATFNCQGESNTEDFAMLYASQNLAEPVVLVVSND